MSIPSAGHAISAYALGVVIGAPLIAVLGARLPRRGLLIGLMVVFLVGNAATAAATSYWGLMTARFVAGVPHGAYFGVASLVAAGLVTPERRGRAVSRVLLGLAVANVAGVPAATWLGQHAGWRAAYVLVAALAALTILLVALLVPGAPGDPSATGRKELRAFKDPQVVLTLLAGAIGFGGMFAMYSYIAPTVTDVAGLSGVRGAALPAGLRARHGRRHAPRRAPHRLVGVPDDRHRHGEHDARPAAVHRHLLVVPDRAC